jgi:hypothetical protein
VRSQRFRYSASIPGPGYKQLIALAGLFLLLGCAHNASAAASNVYISQSGGGSGSSCSDALSVAWFNAAGNWGSGSTQIGPGSTVHLCGTFTAAAGATNYFATQGNGASGSPVTILFESGANLTAPYWGGPAIYVANNYITIDGRGTGIIQATANGTGLTYQQGGACIQGYGASNFLVQNLTCANIYVHTCTATSCTDGNTNGVGIYAYGGNNVQFKNNTVHDTHWAYVWGSIGGAISNGQIGPSNIAYNVDHAFVVSIGNGTVGSITGAYVYGNHAYNFANWDDSNNNNHHDGVHVFDFANGAMSQVYVYNNKFDGNWGTHNNAAIYIEAADQGGKITSCGVFNNVMNPDGGGSTSSGSIADYSTNGCLNANNVSYRQGLGVEFTASGGATFYNNIIANTLYTAVQAGNGGKIAASDYNAFYNLGGNNQFIGPGGTCCIADLALWRSYTGFDVNSITSNPNLSASYTVNVGSPVIGAGKNLYSICSGQPNPGIGALCYDAAGSPRPASAKWDIGAYQYGSGGSSASLSPPVNLVANVQ